MKILSFNINGIRARQHQMEYLASHYAADVVGLQETKVDDPQFPVDAITGLGYGVEFHGQKGHYGVALLSKPQPVKVFKGYPTDEDDAQRRLIGAQYAMSNGELLTVINGYFPQGESREHPTKFPAKQRFYADLMTLLESQFSPQDAIIVMGDVNISREDIDIGIGEDNRKRWLRTGKCSFLPEEREWMQRLMDWGFSDTYRSLHPDATEYSWFDYRSKGFDREPKRGLRIDLILASAPLQERLVAAGIGYDMRAMEKPSDHAPIWAEFDVDL